LWLWIVDRRFFSAATKLEFQLNGSWMGKIALKSRDMIQSNWGKMNCCGQPETTKSTTITDKIMI